MWWVLSTVFGLTCCIVCPLFGITVAVIIIYAICKSYEEEKEWEKRRKK